MPTEAVVQKDLGSLIAQIKYDALDRVWFRLVGWLTKKIKKQNNEKISKFELNPSLNSGKKTYYHQWLIYCGHNLFYFILFGDTGWSVSLCKL